MSIKVDTGKATCLRRGSQRVATLVLGGAVALSSVGCGKVGEVMAMFKFKQANQAYVGQNYQRAAELYEETIANNPDMNTVYFYLGNSYANLHPPREKGNAENEHHLN
jgi:hypothetical protein